MLRNRAIRRLHAPGTQQIFNALRTESQDTIKSQYLLSFLESNGLCKDDTRLSHLMSEINDDRDLTLNEFATASHGCVTLLHKAVVGDLRVPDFSCLRTAICDAYEKVIPNKGGENAQYIPQLADVDPEQFAISVTTVDGQHFSIGDSNQNFCIQSCSKPLSYLIALNDFGEDHVHKCVGTEPSGRKFNEMTLKSVPLPEMQNHAIPHNPMINAGAIMSISMVYPEYNRATRLEKVMDFWKRLSADGDETAIGYDDATYKSESATADRNWCLGYMMKECGAFDSNTFTSLEDTLELYFQICSITNTNKSMSTMAASLANGGVNPFTGERVVSPKHVRCVLPLMLTCGMYDYSGQWSYEVGVPAKSGVGGCIFLVVPNVAGISIWSPRLDETATVFEVSQLHLN